MDMHRAVGLGFGIALSAALCGAAAEPAAPDNSGMPQYDSGNNLVFPADYREWIFLTAGLDMAYAPEKQPSNGHLFENVFVPQWAYKAFLRTGTWPDKTILVMERRTGATNVSINVQGAVQTTEVQGFLVHVKDVKRFSDGGWMFFAYDAANGPGKRPDDVKTACIACHQAHGAVDSTFVQFYPTLLPIATAHGTLSPSYVAETPKK